MGGALPGFVLLFDAASLGGLGRQFRRSDGGAEPGLDLVTDRLEGRHAVGGVPGVGGGRGGNLLGRHDFCVDDVRVDDVLGFTHVVTVPPADCWDR